MRVFLLFLTLLLAGPLQANPFDVKPDFLPVNQAFVLTHDRQADGQPGWLRCGGRGHALTCRP